MNRNKKGLHKVTANVLSLTLASVMAAGTVGEAVSAVPVYAAESSQTENSGTGVSVYLNGTLSGDNQGDGTTKEKAVSSIDQALKLAGSKGTILVCGPVTISSEKAVTIPEGVQIKRADGYTGAIMKITGKGKLTLTGGNLQSSDVDTSGAELGKEAFVQGTKTEAKKAGQVTMNSQVTIASPEAWNSFDFAAAGFSGEGSFAWASQTAPEEYQTTVQVIFTPADTKNYDYSKVEGWDAAKGAVIRNVEVTVESLKPSEPASSEGDTGENNTQEQTPPEETVEAPETPEEQEPEETVPVAGSVTVPGEITLSKPEDIKNFDFGKAGFAGEGSFAWEKETVPIAYETEIKVVFTPSDIEGKDYSQVEGWDAQKNQVIRTVKVLVESLKEDSNTDNAPADNTDKDNEKENGESGDNTKEDADTEQGKQDQTGSDQENASDQDNIEDQTENPDTEEKKPGTAEEDQGTSNDQKEEDQESQESSNGQEEEAPKDEESSNGQEGEAPKDEESSQEENTQETDEDFIQAEAGKTGEVAQEIPQAIPVGSLIDENTGVRVEGDFLPYYVDLQVSYNDELDQLPDAGIGQILSAYEIKLWDLKENEEYKIPEGNKVRVMIPLPENADSFSQLSIAHYLGNSEYEYYTLPTEEYPGNLTIITIEGIEYLTFETASFSPFNVGGSQLVGPGTQLPQSGSSSQNTGNNSSSGTSAGTSSTGNSQTGSSSSGQSVIQPSGNSGSQTSTSSSQSRKTGNQSSSSKVTRVVKTGDNAPIILYAATAAAALILAAVTFIIGKKKRS
ncbi:cell wall anchor protein [Blautia sp. An46]|uniref:cell wall anchor protein n=1 Tax=Blautia sp. An46 TaxID=1965636 RepID=UPI0011243600|nr:cell wall anchor protein [Blautia sp. An46]